MRLLYYKTVSKRIPRSSASNSALFRDDKVQRNSALDSASFRDNRGFSLVEVILSSALFALLAAAIIGAIIFGRESTAVAGARARAIALAEEGLEAARNIRDSGFSNLTSGNHGIAISGGRWIFSGNSDTTDIFTREVSVASIDSSRKHATSTVSWQQNPGRTGSVSLLTRLTSWDKTTSGGCVIPFERANTDIAGTEDGIKIQVQNNYAYVVRTDGTPDFLIFDITDNNNPILSGSLSLADIPTNIFVSGNYAYVSSRNDSQELQIIDISSASSPSVIGTYNAAGTANANGIYVSGTSVYLVRDSSADNEFFIINVSTPSLPILVGSLDLGGTGYEVFVSGNNASVASGVNSQELQVVDITIPATPSLVGSYNISGNTDAFTVAGSGNNIFLGQSNNFFIFNIATPSSPSLSSSLSTTGSVVDIALNLGGGTSAYIGTDGGNNEFQVIDTSLPSSPVLLCSLNITGNSPMNGISYDESTDTAFGATSRDDGEFVIVAPQ